MDDKKPPIGIMPNRIWKEQRTRELLRAIERYFLFGEYETTLKWINELRQLVEELKEQS